MHYELRESKLGGEISMQATKQTFSSKSPEKLDRYTIIYHPGETAQIEVNGLPITLCQNSIYYLAPGELVKIPKGFPHESYSWQFNREFYCIQTHDQEVSCNGLLFSGVLPAPVIQLDHKEQISFELLYKIFQDEFTNRDSSQAEMLRLLLKRLIIKSVRLVRERLAREEKLTTPEVNIIREFSILVDRHFRKMHKVADYAELMYRSPKTLSNIFSRYGDRTPLQIIHERIIMEAKRQLFYTGKSAKEVAYELGFEDASQFNRFFKKMTGETTQTFRKQEEIAA